MNSISTQIYPAGILNTLSQQEVARLADASQGKLNERLRRCVLAVLNSGNPTDDADQVLEQFQHFQVQVIPVNRGIRLDIHNAPASAFVDGKIIRGIRELMSAVIRDLIYFHTEIEGNPNNDLKDSSGITNAVFEILRNANAFRPEADPDVVVCWGGHSISGSEYDYSKEVGYQLGLRCMNICTGCGAGAMKGPMKGATIAHAKQRTLPGRYLGLSEPGIIAVESPNPIVNELVILPDIEKRLEAFVRTGHAVLVFPGGAGTAEEILFLLGVLLHPDNQGIPMPVVFTGPESARDYFAHIDRFLSFAIGPEVREKYRIVIDDPVTVARLMVEGMEQVKDYRTKRNDAYYFNWLLTIPASLQQRFKPTHANMNSLDLRLDRPKHELIRDLRRAFSGIVSGNIKPDGVAAIRAEGPFQIRGDQQLMSAVDELLTAFNQQQRMKLPGSVYEPCYRIVS
ncbi:MAG: nucleotide 5'-monophosphate nucleosidase PpnN [Gammaproteobacteria bacterium]|nr:nucleotide 5'-monophosphate nucleosidase PpnN [Gammaproteobacteria bacterium]